MYWELDPDQALIGRTYQGTFLPAARGRWRTVFTSAVIGLIAKPRKRGCV